MRAIPGTPGPLRWLRYAIGFRLPAENRDWVRHDLTDAGWRTRATLRQFVLVLPLAVVFALLPGALSVRILLVVLVMFGGLFVAVLYADSVRAARLRQHDLTVPDDPDLGRPTDE